MNPGKNFEGQFKISAKNEGIFIIRLNDSSLSWQKEKTARFTVENPCDFLLYYKGSLFPVELKSTEYKSMSIQRDLNEKNKMIKMHQYSSLSNFSLYDGVIPGFIFNFREKDSVKEITYWVTIQDFTDFLYKTDKKSINRLDIVQLPNTIIIDQKIKRVNYTYYIKDLLDKIIKRKEESSDG